MESFGVGTFLLILLVISPLSEAIQIKCVFKYVPWPVIGNSYSCQVRELNITQPKQPVTKVVGVHLPRMSDDRVRALEITRQTCFALPIKITNSFPNVELLQVHKSKLRSISQADLKPFTKLRVLQMHSNELTSLESHLFDFNPGLVKIDFRFQKFKLIDYNILEKLNQLSLADFESSGCLNYYSKEGKDDIDVLKKEIRINCQPIEEMISEIRNLKTKVAILEAENANMQNNAKAIADFENDPVMKKIDLKITQMRAENLKCLQNSEIITRNFLALMLKVDTVEKSLRVTDSCTVKEIANEKCQLEMEELQRSTRELRAIEVECESVEWTKSPDAPGFVCNAINLKVSQRDIEIVKVTSGIQKVLPSDIEELKVFNQLTVFLPLKMAESFPNLKTLSFVNSDVVTVSEGVLSGLNKLRSLNLVHNSIQNIANDAFKDLSSLQLLDLSFNKIDEISAEVLQPLSALVVLKLNNNLLTKLNPQSFQNLKNLSVFVLKGNQLSVIPVSLFAPMQQLTFVDLFGNKCVSTTWSRDSTKTLEAIFKQICQ